MRSNTHGGSRRSLRGRRRALVAGSAVLALASFVQIAAWAAKPIPAPNAHAISVDPDFALQKLKAGNERFVSQQVSTGKPTAARREETAESQHPFAIVLGCADSRTSPEIIFDQNLGDLFVVRTAGNLVDDHALGSIEYAVGHLGARLIVVLGHERCGAVKAAVESATAPGHIESLVRDIQPAVQAARKEQGDLLTNAIHENATLMAEKIRIHAKLGDHAGEVRIVTGYYNLDTGKVQWDQDNAVKTR
jgi:carbonic anhydrase